ncbi:MAG: hypothetical protein J5770_02715 [Bacteroidaceae bacterium]|nr:hypothetical protein [Bacteroidaceae bacterium]
MKKGMFMMAVVLMSALHVNAQTKVDDKEIVGVWMMESMQFEGEKKIVCGKANGYTQFKFYGTDGEYASAGITLTKDGKIVVMPQEYGKYSLKDGWYMEMGRKPLKDAVILTDKNTYKGTWQNRHDIWKKISVPEKVRKYIVDCCKMQETPSDIEQSIKQTMFK